MHNRPSHTRVERFEFASDTLQSGKRALADETPVAFEYNGFAYAVMLSSFDDIEDFAVGFTLSEGLAEHHQDIEDIDVASVGNGVIVRIRLCEKYADGVRDRVRLRVVEGACGLCGITSLNEAFRPLPEVGRPPRVHAESIKVALANLPSFQLKGQFNRAMHLAAFCYRDGTIAAAREDIGRHNALDKLLGCLARSATDAADGFVLLTSRCSVELVEKTVRAGCSMLVTISLPSNLAVKRACDAKLTLLSLARADSFLVFNNPFKNEW